MKRFCCLLWIQGLEFCKQTIMPTFLFMCSCRFVVPLSNLCLLIKKFPSRMNSENLFTGLRSNFIEISKDTSFFYHIKTNKNCQRFLVPKTMDIFNADFSCANAVTRNYRVPQLVHRFILSFIIGVLYLFAVMIINYVNYLR